MAQTSNHVNNELIKFKRDVTYGFVRDHRFGRYMGAGSNAIIRFVRDLSSDGKQINIPLVDHLNGNGVGSGVLTGNEEKIDNYGFPMWADWLRHATGWNKATNKDATIRYMTIGRELLTTFAKRVTKNEIVDALLAIPTASQPAGLRSAEGQRINGVPWSVATAGQKNTWLTNNSDRVLFGNARANLVAGNVASSLLNVDSTNDKLTTGVVDLLKFIAQTTTANKIKPYDVGSQDENFEEMYILFVGSRAMHDLRMDSAMIQSNRDARPRENGFKKNPIFSAGDLLWSNIIITEIPEIDERLTQIGAGASGINVAPVFMCGTSALGYVVGQDPKPTRNDQTDYDFNTGIGVETQYGVGKIAKTPAGSASTVLKDWGVVTGFVASVDPT